MNDFEASPLLGATVAEEPDRGGQKSESRTLSVATRTETAWLDSVRRGQDNLRDRMLARLVVERGLVERGDTTAASQDGRPGGLGERLVDRGHLSQERLEELSQELDLLEVLDTASDEVTPEEVHQAAREGGMRVGRYLLVDEIGSGGMGSVWRGWDGQLSRWVALKFLKVREPQLVRRFMREATLLGRLSHSNITRVYEVGIHESRPYLVMELISGGALGGGVKIDRREATRIVRDAARALQYAHSEGVVHRDLKPSNILRSEDGKVFVTDFGLARLQSEGGNLTVSGALLGTPSFMAPEQAQGRRADERTDVYGLGATLFALVEGRPPYAGDLPAEIVRRAAHSIAPTVAGNDDLTIVCKTAMERDRADRYQSAGELADDLDRYLRDEPVAAQPINSLMRGWRRARRHPLAATTIAAVALIVIVFGFLIGDNVMDQRERRRADAILLEAPRLESLIRQLRNTGKSESELHGTALSELGKIADTAVTAAPGYATAYFYRGLVRRWSNQPALAIEDFDAALENDPRHSEARAERAEALFDRIDLPLPDVLQGPDGVEFHLEVPEPVRQRLLEVSREYALLPEDHAKHSMGGALAALGSGDYAHAAEFFEQIVKKSPTEFSIKGRLLSAQIASGDGEAAEKTAGTLLDFGYRPFVTRLLLAYALADQARWDSAVEIATDLLEEDPEEPSIRKNIAFWLAKGGRAAESIEHYDRLLENDPRNADLLRDRSAAHFELGHALPALADATRALDLAPDTVENLLAAGLAFSLFPTEAAMRKRLSLLDRALEIAPDNQQALQYRSGARLQLYLFSTEGDNRAWAEAALADAEHGIELAGGRAIDPLLRGNLLNASFASSFLEQSEKAVAFLTRLIDGADDPFYRKLRGRAHRVLGNCSAAVQDFSLAGTVLDDFTEEAWRQYQQTCATGEEN